MNHQTETERARRIHARAAQLKAKLNAHHAAGPDDFLSSAPPAPPSAHFVITDSAQDKDGADGAALAIMRRKLEITEAGGSTGRGRRLTNTREWSTALRIIEKFGIPLSDGQRSRAVRAILASWRLSGRPIEPPTAREYVRKSLLRLRDHVRSLSRY